jgi:Acyclic terpene utilisation family protein AtuA
MKSLRIGNGCGFWGDNLDAPRLLADKGALDYLTLEYLAELTLSILALQRQRNAEAGYATDFIDVLESLVPILKDQPHLKIVTNAGGMNPAGCGARARAILEKNGLKDRRVAVTSGDDLMPRLDALMAAGCAFVNVDTGEPLSVVRSRVVSANAYLGARPIVDALGLGAFIVVTGRVADASLTLAPAVYELGWPLDDWDRLAGGTAAGHLIECGAQATGGLWCNWREAGDLAHVGYPIAQIEADGSFLLTKPAGTGGAVNRETVSEQLLYEVGDPAAYLTPDVVADFTTIQLTERGRDVVHVGNAHGKPATDTYKVSIAYRDGYGASGTLVVAGPSAVAKARRCGEIVLERLRRASATPQHAHVEVLGAGECLPGAAPVDPPEVVLRIAVRDDRRGVVERFTKELAPLVTSGPPGVTGYTTGRPVVREVFAYWPALVAKDAVASVVL